MLYSVAMPGALASTGTASETSLRTALSQNLPDHMIPAHFVTFASFPLTPNRKVDRKALPLPMAAAPVSAGSEPPKTDVEAQLAAIWQRVLGVARVGARDNFFALGGHSLLAVQAHREIREALGTTKLSITDIFRFPKLADLAKHLEDKPKGAAAPEALDRGDARTDAMARRLAMRQRRMGEDA